MNDKLPNAASYRILRAILNIGFGIGILLLAILMADILVNAFLPQVRGQFAVSSALKLDGFLITPPSGSADVLNPAYMLGKFGMIAAGLVCVLMLRNIVNSLENTTPFTAANVKRIRIIGWAVFAQAYLNELSNYLFAKDFADTAVQSGTAPAIQAQFTLIPNGAFLALCILVLAEVFRYGCTLQREHDTTV